MNSYDPDLLRALADADVPPPPGAPIGSGHLVHRARMRTLRQAVAASGIVLLAALVAPWPRCDGDTEARDGDHVQANGSRELRAFVVELDQLRQQVAEWSAARQRSAERQADERRKLATTAALNCRLAGVRADAALAMASTKVLKEDER